MSQVSLPDLELQNVEFFCHFCLHTFLSRIFYLNYQIIIMYVWLQIRPLTVLDMYYWFKNYFKLSGLKQHTLFPFLWDKVEPWVFWDFCIGSQGVTGDLTGENPLLSSLRLYLLTFFCVSSPPSYGYLLTSPWLFTITTPFHLSKARATWSLPEVAVIYFPISGIKIDQR